MSSGRRGRGGADRGGRGGSTQSRGAIFGGTPTGPRANASFGSATTTTLLSKRGQRGDRGQRGTFRGGANTRGSDNSPRGNFRGRGSHMTSSLATPTTISNTTPYAQDDYAERLNFLRKDRPRQRAQFIKEGRMNPEGQIHLSEAVKIVGICQDMCPEFERVRRIVEDDLKLPEFTAESLQSSDRKSRVPDESRMVKAYQRSAAGMEVELVSDIRPPSVCLKTMKYMIERIDNENLEFLYGWLWDRTRAIRKDLRTQAVDKPEDIAIYLECFEQCARLLLICLHQMSQTTDEDYSHQQDVEQLNQTCLSLKERYSDNRKAKIISPNEAEFLAYRFIVGLHTRDPMLQYEIHNVPEPLRQNRRIQTAIHIYRAGKSCLTRSRTLNEAQQNWMAFWSLVRSPSVSYLMACAAEISFNQIRHIVLDTVHRAYRNKKQDWTIPKLMEVLGFDTEDDVQEFCEPYGFTFGVNAEGYTFLDFDSNPYAGKGLEVPNEAKPQMFSQGLVESKRFGRLLSAVIKGMSVSEARTNGYMVESGPTEPTQTEADAEAEDSLFIPDDSTTKPTGFATGSGLSGFSSGTSTDTSSKLNPFANPFQPPKATATKSITAQSPLISKPNPFTTNTNAATSSPNPFAAASGSSLFKPNENTGQPSQFSWGKPSPSVTLPSTETPVNPVTNPAISTTTPATGQTVQPGLFDPFKNAIKFSPGNGSLGSPFATGSSTSSPSKLAEQPISQSSTRIAPKQAPAALPSPFQGFSTAGSAPTPTAPASGFNFSSPQLTSQPSSDGSSNPFTSAAGLGTSPATGGTPVSTTTPNAVSLTQDDQEQKDFEENQRRTREEQERRTREEQERKTREERERRVHEEKERLAREAQEQRIREERQRAAEHAQQQERIRHEKALAFRALTESVFLESDQSLLQQFVEQQVSRLLPEVIRTLKQEEALKRGKELYESRRRELIHWCVTRWYEQVAKKKRAGRARNRRQWLKEHADQLLAVQVEETRNLTIKEQARIGRNSNFKKPEAPASANRVQKRSVSPKKGKAVVRAANGVNDIRSSTASTPSGHTRTTSLPVPTYKHSTAPIDRTETDWFKLRAMGVDPSKYRKRSHDSDSEEEVVEESERKRARTSTSSGLRASSRASLPSPSATTQTEDDLAARFAALKQSWNRSTPTSTTRPTAQPSSIIERARALLYEDPASDGSRSNMQHDFSHSVPDLSLGQSGFGTSAYGKSLGTPITAGKPAYWGRTSRFVPQHLYGKGADAVREYLHQSRGTTSAATSVEPLELSSPITTQQSYVTNSYHEYEDEEDEEDEDEIEELDEQDESEEADEDEDEEIEGVDEDEEIDSGVEDEEDDEVLYDEEEVEYEEEYEETEQFGLTYYQEQNTEIAPGGTQDDAIELSD